VVLEREKGERERGGVNTKLNPFLWGLGKLKKYGDGAQKLRHIERTND